MGFPAPVTCFANASISLARQQPTSVAECLGRAPPPVHGKRCREDETRTPPRTALYRAGSVPSKGHQIRTQRWQANHPRYIAPAEQGMEPASASGRLPDASDQQAQDKRRRVGNTGDGPCISEEDDGPEEDASGAPEDHRCESLEKGVPRTLIEPRPVDGNPKPLCTIPFNVSMSNAKAGKFDRAHEPVFVYLADARMKTGIRIRFSLIEGTRLPDMKAQPFHDGKPITKGHLAMSIATQLENENVLTTNKRESAGELFFVDLVQERWETFRPTFKRLFGGGALSA